MRRKLTLLALTVVLSAGVGCEEGEIPDNPGGGGGSTQVLSLLQITQSPAKGESINFEATVTTDGTPDSNVTVTFTTENPSLTNEVFSPPTPQTNFQGTATTVLSTFTTTPTTFTVRATTPTNAVDTVTVSLLP